MKRWLMFFNADGRWVFQGDHDTQSKAESLTGLVVNCLLIDTETGERFERLSPRGAWHQHEKAA